MPKNENGGNLKEIPMNERKNGMYNLEVYQICNVTYDCMLGVESWRVSSV